jgi:hypothetical protein
MTILEVYRHPNFSALATAFVIGFVLLIDAISLSWFVFSSGMLPYGSDERMQRLLRLKDSNPKRYDEVITAMVHKHRQKPWLLRRWTRPKIPKEL